ncbi:MAG: iron ABC transporter permease [Eggerthellaceae bacterium]|nr:iron ABC transporter permease [Eggerthellaceae bacterium]
MSIGGNAGEGKPIGAVRKVASFAVTSILLVALFFFAVNAGSLKVTIPQLINGLFVEYDPAVATVWDLRFPRIFIALVGGAALATSGVLLQAVIRNPLADPGIIGISSGAAFAAVVVTAFAPALFFFTPVIAFAGGLAAFALVYSLSFNHGNLSPLRIILVGVAIGAMFSGLSAVIGSSSGGSGSSVTNIIEANITMKTWSEFRAIAIYGSIGLILSFFTCKRCDILMLEDKTARSLGVNVNLTRVVISAIAVLLASITTAIVGPISFLGLVVPHCARLLVGTSHKVLIPFSMILGAFCLLAADTLGRTVIAPMEISAAVVMAVIGGPVFVLLLKGARGNYAA